MNASLSSDAHESPTLPPLGDVARLALQRAVHAQWENLLKNPSPENLTIVIHHWNLWSPAEKRELQAKKIDLTAIVRAAIYEDDLQVKHNGFDAIAELQTYALIPDLLKLTVQPNYVHQATAGTILAKLVQALYRNHQLSNRQMPRGKGPEEMDTAPVPRAADGSVIGPRTTPVFRWPQEIENLRALTAAGLGQYRTGSRPEVLLVQVSFAPLDDPLLDQILADQRHPAHPALLELLENSDVEAVISRVSASLTLRRPQAALGQIWRRRSDLVFIRELLQTVARESGPEVKANLRKLPKPVWLHQLVADLAPLTLVERFALLDLIRYSLPSDEEVLDAFGRILSHAELPLRRRTVHLVCQMSGVRANQIVAELIEWETDPQILMTLIPEMRKRNLSRAMKRLLSLLDHGHLGVRTTAAEAFHDCTIDRYLAAYDLLEDPVRRSTGQLVYKVDPSTNQVLEAELNCGNRIRQIRTLQAIRSIGNIDDLSASVMELAKHPDPRLKIAAIGTLAGASAPEAKALIRRYLVDENPAIRKAAEFSLDLARDIIEVSRPRDR